MVFFWTLVGAAVGALVAALVARNQFVGARREHRMQLRRRDLSIQRLESELEEDRADYRKRSDDFLREIAGLKRDRSSLGSELEESRRTIATLQSNLETLRASARESESRLSAALDAAREEAAARRSTTAEEFRTTQEAAERARLDLSRRLADLESHRSRLEADLAVERRTNAERQESLRSILATLREQYRLASAERDTLARTLDEERSRADAAEAESRRAREEYARRIESEHQEAMEILSRVWEYVHAYMQSHPADLAPEAERPAAAASARQPARAVEPAAEQHPSEPLTTDREVAKPHAPTMADSCPAEDYDIERALEEKLPPASSTAPSPAQESPQGRTPASFQPAESSATPPTASSARPPEPVTSASQQQPERGWRSVPPPAAEVTRVRHPISAMRRGDDVLVVCDDGSVWLRRPTGWIEEPPVPGSDANGEKGPGEDVTSRAQRG